MPEQLHKRLSDEQVKTVLEKYFLKEIKTVKAMDLLGIKRSQFFEWARKYQRDPLGFSVQYQRREGTRKIEAKIEKAILSELQIDKRLIEDKKVPLKSYNYSYIRKRLFQKSHYKVCVPTIIDRAKKGVFICPSPKEKGTIEKSLQTT